MNQVKKVKRLRLAFTVCGVALALGTGSAFVINATNSSTVHAAEVQLDANSDFARLAPTTVNYTVHKGMTLLGKTQASVVDDGNAKSWNNDTTDFDPVKYGKVGYTAYDITNTIESGDMTDAGLKTIGDDIAKDPTGNYSLRMLRRRPLNSSSQVALRRLLRILLRVMPTVSIMCGRLLKRLTQKVLSLRSHSRSSWPCH